MILDFVVQLGEMLVVLAAAPLLAGYVRTLKARLVGRRGPPLLQPYRDLLRLPHERTYIVYCSSGARSGRTVELMRELEFPSAYHLAGGLYNWLECGFKVEEADEL